MKAIFLSDVKIGYISSMTYSCGWKDFFLLNDSFYRTSAICVSHVCKKSDDSLYCVNVDIV